MYDPRLSDLFAVMVTLCAVGWVLQVIATLVGCVVEIAVARWRWRREYAARNKLGGEWVWTPEQAAEEWRRSREILRIVQTASTGRELPD
jgi:hypothetical protein